MCCLQASIIWLAIRITVADLPNRRFIHGTHWVAGSTSPEKLVYLPVLLLLYCSVCAQLFVCMHFTPMRLLWILLQSSSHFSCVSPVDWIPWKKMSYAHRHNGREKRWWIYSTGSIFSTARLATARAKLCIPNHMKMGESTTIICLDLFAYFSRGMAGHRNAPRPK